MDMNEFLTEYRELADTDFQATAGLVYHEMFSGSPLGKQLQRKNRFVFLHMIGEDSLGYDPLHDRTFVVDPTELWSSNPESTQQFIPEDGQCLLFQRYGVLTHPGGNVVDYGSFGAHLGTRQLLDLRHANPTSLNALLLKQESPLFSESSQIYHNSFEAASLKLNEYRSSD